MKYREMSKNYIFRELERQMTKEEVAELCFKSVRTVTGWDEGNPIPPECKRLMRMAKGRELSISEDWEQFKMLYDRIELPTGQVVRPQQILADIALEKYGFINTNPKFKQRWLTRCLFADMVTLTGAKIDLV